MSSRGPCFLTEAGRPACRRSEVAAARLPLASGSQRLWDAVLTDAVPEKGSRTHASIVPPSE